MKCCTILFSDNIAGFVPRLGYRNQFAPEKIKYKQNILFWYLEKKLEENALSIEPPKCILFVLEIS